MLLSPFPGKTLLGWFWQVFQVSRLTLTNFPLITGKTFDGSTLADFPGRKSSWSVLMAAAISAACCRGLRWWWCLLRWCCCEPGLLIICALCSLLLCKWKISAGLRWWWYLLRCWRTFVQIAKSAIVGFVQAACAVGGVCWVWFADNLCSLLLCKWRISAGLRWWWYLLRCWRAFVQIAKSAIVGFVQAACAVGGVLSLVCW